MGKGKKGAVGLLPENLLKRKIEFVTDRYWPMHPIHIDFDHFIFIFIAAECSAPNEFRIEVIPSDDKRENVPR